MKAFIGRIGQHRILSSEATLSRHLLETELFSEESLNKFIEVYKSLVIKPLLGPGEIFISLNNNQFYTITIHDQTTHISKEKMYYYLKTHVLKKTHYIIQPQKQHSLSFLHPFHYYVTLHQESASANWRVISKTEVSRASIGKFFYMYFLKKIEKLSVLAAEKLGEAFPHCRTIVIEIIFDLKGEIWIKDTFLHFSRSKWSQFITLTAHKPLAPFIPATSLLTTVTFHEFLMKYKKVIIKPYDGQQGMGIVQISTDDNDTYVIYSGRKKHKMPNLDQTFNYLKENYLTNQHYIIQQKLPLMEIDDCPLDIRVITQKNEAEWTVTGKLAKVAGKGFFVTNAIQKLLLLEEAIHQSNATHMNIPSLEAKIEAACLFCSKTFEESHSDISIIGFDIAISPLGDVWIIEANFKPDLSMFYNLEDKTFYKNIMRAKRAKR